MKAAGDHWVVQEKKGHNVFSGGVWAPAASIVRIRAELDAERSTKSYANARLRIANGGRMHKRSKLMALRETGQLPTGAVLSPGHHPFGCLLSLLPGSNILPERCNHRRKSNWSEDNPEGRWRAFDYEELEKRDKANLDIFWLRDKSLEDSDDLPDPDVLAQEIADDLQTALDQITAIAGELGE